MVKSLSMLSEREREREIDVDGVATVRKTVQHTDEQEVGAEGIRGQRYSWGWEV